MDWNALLSNPNTWKAAAGMGAAIGGNTTGGRMGQVASQYLGDVAMQGAMSPQAKVQASNVPYYLASPEVQQGMTQPQQAPQTQPQGTVNWGQIVGGSHQGGGAIQPTPIGADGPDEVTHKLTHEGTTTTIKSPTQAKLAQLNPQQQQSNLPLEAYPAQGGAGQTPFYQALLGNS